MVTEEDDRLRIVYGLVFPDVLLEEDRRHRRDVLMREAQVGPHETGIVRLYVWHARLVAAGDHVASENLFGDRHRALCRVDRRQLDLTLHARHVEREEAT